MLFENGKLNIFLDKFDVSYLCIQNGNNSLLVIILDNAFFYLMYSVYPNKHCNFNIIYRLGAVCKELSLNISVCC